jgi:hypothetical protein
LLQQIYDECLKELVTILAVREPSELNGIKDELALYALSSPLRRGWRIRRKSRSWLSMA